MSKNKALLTFHGGVGTPTGSNFLLEIGTIKILVDCGLFQGNRNAGELNRGHFAYSPKEIDALLVTHAHLDHIGRIPKLVREGFSGTVYSTSETQKIAKLLLEDAVSVMERRHKEKEGRKPFYDRKDVARTLSLWKAVSYHEQTDLGEGVSFTLKDAGHILGSALIEISRGDRKIVFTGDLGNSPAPILHNTEVITDANYLVVESVYGNKNHESAANRAAILEDIIENTVKNNGVLMIPAFSIERTQTLLYEINNLVESEKIPEIPVFLDSPLAIKVTEIYKNSSIHFNRKTRKIIESGDDIFSFPKLKFTIAHSESEKIFDEPNPKIIIAGSGMSEGGRIKGHEKRLLSDPANTILIVGFQSAGTVGRQIQDGAKEVEIDRENIPVRARVETIFSYSAHKDSNSLLRFVERMVHKVEKVFVVLGEPKASMFLAQRIKDYLGVTALVPKTKESVVLDL